MKKSLVYSIVLVFIFSLSMFYVGGRVEEINLTSPSNVSWTASQTPTFTYSVAGNETSYTCDLIVNDVFFGQNVSVANDTAIYILANDTITPAINLTWYVNCSDGIELNQSSAFLVTIDGVAPISNLIVSTNNTWITDSTPTISFNVTDNLDPLVNYSIIVDGTVVNWTSVASNTQVTYTFETPLSEAAHNIVVEAMDEGGNRTNSSVLLLYVDDTVPVATITSPLSVNVSSTTPTLVFNLTDNVDLAIDYNVIIDGVSVNASTATNGSDVTYTLEVALSEGTHNITIEGLDNSSKRANSSVLILTVDNTVPVANLILPADETWTTSTTPTLSFNVTDNMDNIINYSIIIDGSVVNATSATSNTALTYVVEVALSEAMHSIVVEAVDDAGNRANSSVSTLYVDNTVPVATISSPISTNITSTTPTLTFNLTDNVDTAINYSVIIDGVSVNSSTATNGSDITYTLEVALSQGTHNITIEGLDNSSKRANSSVLILTVDNTVPVANLILPADETWTTSTTPTLSFNVTDNLDNIINYSIIIDGSVVNATSATSNTALTYVVEVALSEAMHSIVVEALDDAGNRANSSVATLYVDATNPAGEITSPVSENSTVTQPTLVFNLTDNVDLAINYTIFVDGVGVNSSTATNGTAVSHTLESALTEGTHNIVVEALDNASNRANTSVLTITVDTTVPAANLNLPADETWTTSTTPTLSFNVTDNLDNVINYSIIIDGSVVNASWVTNNTEISHVLEVALSEAVHSIVVESMDEAGNRANSSVVTLYVDATNPQGEITSPSSGNTTDNTPTLVFNLTDNVDTALNYTVFINGNSANAGIAVNGTEETVGLGTLSDGSYTVVVEVLDNASNRVNSSAIYLTIDSTSPVVYLNSPTNNSEANDLSVEFIFNATDNMDMNLSYTLFINDTANRTGYTQANNTVVTFTESGFTNGYSYSWFVEVADDAGNAVNYSGVWYFTINDTTAPDTAPVIAQAGVNDSDNDGNVELVWTTDVYAASYKVYRHSSEINNATSLSAIGSTALTAFEDNTTVNGTTYWYAVTSLDTAGNENASLVSTSYNATANDQNKPKLATNFNASTLTTGAIYLDWSATVADVLDQPEVQVTYRIFRNVNVTLINTTAYSNDYVANTTDYNYTHTNLTTGINYTYVITVVDDANNFNNTNASRIAYESSSCSADYNYGAWSDCSSSEKSRTGTRTCYGGGSSTSTQTESCTSSTSSSSGSSTTSGTVAATAPRSSMAWMNVAKGEKVHLEITKEEIGVTSIELTVNAAKTFMQLTVEKLDEKPTDVKEVKKHYRYLKFIKSNVQDSEIEGLVKIQFKVEKSWLIDNDGVSSQIVMRRYVDGEWVDLPTKLISDDSEFVYFEAETPGFSYFAIALGDSAVDETTTTEENTATEPDSGVDDTTAGTETVTEPETEPATSPITQPKKGSFNWVLLIAGLVLVIAAILLYHHPSRKKGVSFTKKVKGSLKTKDDHEIKEVKEYVKEARKEGYSDTEIKSNLIEAGWEIELIEKMVGKDVGSDKEPKAHPDKEKSDSTKPKKKKAHKKSKH